MKFADKLFLATAALLTFFFTVFGIRMLSSNFSELLDREIARGCNESRMFHFLFEMGYQSTEEYGTEYAISRTLDGILDSVESEGTHCFVLNGGEWLYGGSFMETKGLRQEAELLQAQTGSGGEYVYKVCRAADGFYLVILCAVESEPEVALGMCRELNEIYQVRSTLLEQYRIDLSVLLLVGTVCSYFLSRYITRPIAQLGRTAARIADGEFSLRSRNQGSDEIGRLAQNFNRMADRLVRQMEEKVLEAKQKEDFTAAFAHELKTPLTSIIGYADMMNTMKLSEGERAEAAFYIFDQGKRLECLSHKLLELVGMDKNPLTMRVLQAKQLEETLRVSMRPVWERKGIRGRIDMEKGSLRGDEDLLLSLFYNLLDNANKATDKGEEGFVLLKGTVLSDGGYEVKVIDNGRGIPAEEIGRITEAFYMVDKSRSRKEGGAGIGMALCQKIIRLHDAVMQIDSRPGEGTVIKVVFRG